MLLNAGTCESGKWHVYSKCIERFYMLRSAVFISIKDGNVLRAGEVQTLPDNRTKQTALRLKNRWVPLSQLCP